MKVYGLDYIGLAPGYVKGVLEEYERWEGKDTLPLKFKELILILEIEVTKRYSPGAFDRIAAMPPPPKYKDTKLS